ncbi:MAG: hypothetical protein RIR70_298 [Pseudomonadota bacterium]
MPIDHYENFPVASVLLPRKFREPIEAIYAFARTADDIADEGDAPPAKRLDDLARFEAALDAIALGEEVFDPLFKRLSKAIHEWGLPIGLLRDLLDAFKQDVVKTRYEDIDSLLDYCRRSANPVGRLLLHLYRATDADKLAQSDAICSALQIINFLQDVAIDWQKNRVYLPQKELAEFRVTEEEIRDCRLDSNWPLLMHFQITRARLMMMQGAPLARALPGRLGWELRLVVLGGLRILEKIEAADHDVFLARPTLKALDWALLSWRALFSYPRHP